jgi:hypothetical protein
MIHFLCTRWGGGDSWFYIVDYRELEKPELSENFISSFITYRLYPLLYPLSYISIPQFIAFIAFLP